MLDVLLLLFAVQRCSCVSALFQAIRAPPAEVKCVVFDSVLCWFGFILFGFLTKQFLGGAISSNKNLYILTYCKIISYKRFNMIY